MIFKYRKITQLTKRCLLRVSFSSNVNHFAASDDEAIAGEELPLRGWYIFFGQIKPVTFFCIIPTLRHTGSYNEGLTEMINHGFQDVSRWCIGDSAIQ